MGYVHWLDIVVMVVYFGAITGAGIFFARRNKSTETYFLGNRNFPGWAIGISLVGTSISSITFLAYPGDAYKTAYLRLLPAFTLPIAILIASIYFLPFFRRGGLTSAYEYLESRFGPGTRLYAAIAFIVFQAGRIGMILYLLSLLVYEFMGPAFQNMGLGQSEALVACIIVGGLFVGFYTVAGGIEAVIWTDVVQTIILVLGGILCLAVIVWKLPDGFAQIFSVGFENSKFAFAEVTMHPDGPPSVNDTSWAFSLFEKTALMMLLIGLGNWLAEYSSNQNVVQRYAASRSMREARKAMWVCCLTSIPIWTFFMFLGTALYVFFLEFPHDTATNILYGHGDAKAEQILPFFVFKYLPIGLSGMVIAAVVAAAMSSLDSSINSVATVSVVDIYKRHLAPDKDDHHYLRVARGIAITVSALMILIAVGYAIAGGKTAQHVSTVMTALTAGGLLGLFLLGFLVPFGDGRAIVAGAIATVSFSGIMVLKELGFITWMPIDSYYTGIIGHFLMFSLGFIGCCIIGKTKRDLTNLTVWTQDKTPVH